MRGERRAAMSGDWTEDYMRWKVETLELQHSHKETAQQRTGLWGETEAAGHSRRDQNEYSIELSPGWR